MTVKTDVIDAGDQEAAGGGAVPWWEDDSRVLGSQEAARLLGWDNPNSVRNRARAGGFRWRQKGNGRLVFHRGDVAEYAARQAAPAGAEG